MPVPKAGMIHDECDVAGPADVVFDYLATFSNTQEWDPGCLEGRRTDSGRLGVGSKFDLVTTFKGSKSNMTYEITKFEKPNYVELKGESDVVTTFKGSKSNMTYEITKFEKPN